MLIAVCLLAQAKEQLPLLQREIEDLLAGSVPQKRIATLVRQYGVAFVPDANSVAQLRQKGASDEVIEAVRRTSFEHSVKMAKDLIAKGLNDDAEVSLQNAVTVDDTDAKVWAQLGDVQRYNRNNERALASYRKAHQLLPESPSISVRLAYATLTAGDVAGAISLCREVTNTSPEYADAHLCMASGYLSQGDRENAVKEADKASLLGSKDPLIYSISPNLSIAKVISAMGGIAVVQSVHSLHENATETDTPASGVPVTYDMDDTILYPDRYVHIARTSKGELRSVYSPSSAFITNGEKIRELTADEKSSYASALGVGLISVAQNLGNSNYQFKASGTEMIDGKLTSVVDISTGAYATRWYVDPQTGHILRTLRNYGTHQRIANISAWLASDGLTLPSRIATYDDGKLRSTLELKSFNVNVPENPALFARPSAAVAENATPARPSTSASTAPRLLVLGQRTQAHIKASSPEIYHSIEEDLMQFLQNNRIPMVAETSARPLETVPNFDVYTAAGGLQRYDASHYFLITVDRPFNAWVKITASCYDRNGGMLWNDFSEARGFSEIGPVGIRRALDKLRNKLLLRIAQRQLPPTATAYVAPTRPRGK